MKNLFFAVCCLLLALLSSCNDGPEYAYQVDAAFEPYVQKFKNDAKRYGQNFDSTALIMRFANLTDNKAGQCYMYRKPILIEIDQTYWESIATSTNADNLREELIFHEMGHGFMQREHLNNQLTRGDWQSMMFGDELPNNLQPTLNYRGMRKEYYIQELFTLTTEKPAWSTIEAPDFSTVQEQEIMRLKTNEQCQFTLQETEYYHSYIENNQLVVKNKSALPIAIPLNANIETNTNFCIEINYQISGETTHSGGVFWGETDPSKTNYNLHYCELHTNQHVDIGEYSCLIPFMDLYVEAITTGFNQLTIRKQDNYLYYFINGVFAYYNDLTDLPIGGNNMGIILSENSTMRVQSMLIKAAPVVNAKNTTIKSAIVLPSHMVARSK